MAFFFRRGFLVPIWALAALHAVNLYAHAPHILLSSSYMNFIAAPGTNAAPQTVLLTNSTHGRMPWTAAAATVNGGNWLNLATVGGAPSSQISGELPGIAPGCGWESASFTVSVVSASLPAGVYYGTITVAAPGSPPDPNLPLAPPADNTPQIIEVALTITTTGQAAPGISVLPKSLDFSGGSGTGRSYSVNVVVSNAGGGVLTWSATTDTASGGNWLSAAQLSGSVLAVTASVGSLTNGIYTGRVIITADGAANSPKIVPVTFTIKDPLPPNIQLSSSSLQFSMIMGAGSPQPQKLTISNAGDVSLNWQADAATFNGGSWLAVSPNSGTDFGTITVTADPASLSPGTYAARITITAPGAVNSPAQVQVTFVINPPQPVLPSNGIVNAATFLPGPLAPGEIASLFGANLGPRDPVIFSLDPATNKLPTTLGGTTITFNGVKAPLFFVSANQVNFQVPFEIAFQNSAQMVVNVAGLSPAATIVPIADAALGIFTVAGTNRAAALNQDNSLNSPDNPAPVGSVIQLFVTGQGMLDTKIETGSLAPASPPFPAPRLQPVGVTIGGIQANVLFAGLAPGFAGLTQINAEIPRAVIPSSNVAVSVGMGFFQSPVPALIAIK